MYERVDLPADQVSVIVELDVHVAKDRRQQDLVRSLQLAHLGFEILDPLRIVRRRPRPLARVDRGLLDPRSVSGFTPVRCPIRMTA